VAPACEPGRSQGRTYPTRARRSATGGGQLPVAACQSLTYDVRFLSMSFQSGSNTSTPAMHAGAQPGVERGQRLVEEQYVRADGEGAGDGHPLLLSAGQLPRIAARVRRHAGHLQCLGDPGADLALGGPARLQSEGHVVLDPHVREEGVLLHDHADAPPVRRQVGDVPLAEEHPPGRGPYEPGDRPQRGGLAGAGRPEQRHHLAGLDGQVERVEDDVAVVGDRDGVEPDAHLTRPL
jgi:hypothetical protein